MTNRTHGPQIIAGSLLAGAGGVTIGLAAIAAANVFATVIGALLIATGGVVMLSVWLRGTTFAGAMAAVGNALAAPFRAYARLYRSQWRGERDKTQQ